MSWYVALDGKKIWVEEEATAYIVDEMSGPLTTESLSYCAANTQKAIYQEHSVDEDMGSGKAKKKQSGRQRGFIVRVAHDERTRVTPNFQAAANWLIDSGQVSRIDVEEVVPRKKKDKARDNEKGREADTEVQVMQPLGSNECRMLTVARCQHTSYGPGFKLHVSEAGREQRLFLFTDVRDVDEWHSRLVGALQHSGCLVVDGRLSEADAQSAVAQAKAAKEKPPREEQDWLDSVLGRCMVHQVASPPEKSALAEGEEESVPAAPPPKKERPPWLRR